MKRARERDDAAAARVQTSDFCCIFNGFCTRYKKDCLLPRVARCRLVETLRESDIHVVRRDDETGMAKAVELRLDRRDHPGMIMSNVGDGNAGGQIDITLALHVPQFGISGLVGEYLVQHHDALWRLAVADLQQLFVGRHGLSPKPLRDRLHEPF